jgi:hypothetical protein
MTHQAARQPFAAGRREAMQMEKTGVGPVIRPGSSIDIVWEEDPRRTLRRLLPAVIYDVVGDRIVVSQTQPPQTRSHIGRTLTLTFLKRGERHILRYSFSALFIDIILEYRLVSTEKVIALVFEIRSKPEPTTFRLHFRVKPPADSGLMLLLGEEKLNLLDISLIGVRFSHKRKPAFKTGEIIPLTIIVDRSRLDIDAQVLRAWQPAGTGAVAGLQHVRAKFINIYKEFESLLGKWILMIERELLARGKHTS